MSTASVSLDLTGPQLQALDALLAGRSSTEAAEAGSVSPCTLRGWLQQPAFRAAFLQGQQQLFHQVSMQLAGAASRALRTLLELSEDPEQRGSVRMAAANKVLHLFLHHGPRVSALLAPPETAETPTEDVVTKARAYDSIMESLERIYGSDDAEAAPTPATPPQPASAPDSALQPEPPASASAGRPAAAPAPIPRDHPTPMALTLSGRIPAETLAPLPAPGINYVPCPG